MGQIQFANAEYLYALLAVLPAAAGLWYASFWLRRKARKQYGEEQLVDRYTRPLRLASEVVELAFWALSLALLVVATAGPVKPDTPQKAQAGTLQVMLVIDGSKSIRAEDYRAVMPGPLGEDGTTVLGPHGSRLDMSKHLITEKIMPAIQGNQIGIVTYSGAGFERAPLTDDFEALRFVLANWMTVHQPLAPGGGSHMVDGLSMALELFKRQGDPNKEQVIVLLSDGGFDDQIPELNKVLDEIVARKIRVIIVGLGGTAPISIPEYTLGRDGLYQFSGWAKKGGNAVQTQYDPAVLEHIQTATGADLVHLEQPSDLNVQWAAKIAGSKTEARQSPVFQYPLAAAIFLLVALFSRVLLFKRKDLV